jgi:hypothetical protein
MKKQLHKTKLSTVLFSIFCFLCSMFSQAQTYDWQWAYRGGGTQNSIDGATWDTNLEQIFDVKIDQYNNYYFAGTVLNYNPSFKGEDITKYGPYATDNDIYIVSLDCEGNFRWHTTIGGEARETTISMDLDSLGGLYISFSTFNISTSNNSSVTPHYAPGVALGHSTLTGTSPNNRQIALIKYDTDGNYLWHIMPQDENVTNTPTDGYFQGRGGAYSLVAEADGTLHWHCFFLPGNHLDGDLVVTEAMSPYHAILKYDKDGNYLGHFPVPLGGSINNSNVKLYYETLTQRYYVAIGLQTANSIPSWDGEELCGAIIALDNQGNELWSHTSPIIPGTNAAVVSLAIDSQLNIYLAGNAANQGDDATEFAGYTFTHHNSGPYLIKLDSDGNLLWGTNLNPPTGGTAAALNACVGCKGRDLAINGDEIAMATGLHENTWGSISMPRLYGHQQDPVLIRFDKETGVPFAMHDIEGPGGVRDELMTVAVDHNGNYIVGGYGRSTLFLNHDTIDPIYSMGGDSDFFVAKLAKNTECGINVCYGIIVPLPTGNSTQTVTSGVTLADLEVDGENLQWYANAELTEPLAETHIVENNTTYYVTQTVGVCTSEALTVTIVFQGTNPCQGIVVPVPTGNSTQTVTSGMTLADLEVEGENLQWYADVSLTQTLSSNHIVQNNTTYYVTQTVGVCTSEALAVTVVFQSTNPCQGVVVPLPTGNSTQTVTSGVTLADLEIEGENLQWYADVSLTQTLPSNHVVQNNMTYYVTQTVGVCTSEALAVTVTFQSTNPCQGIVVPVPTGNSTQTVTSGMTLADLEVDGENLQWYADADLTEPLLENHIVENNTIYYVTQTVGVCTSEALAVEVTTLGISDIQMIQIKLYPNPTNGILYIETSQEIQSYEVYNLIGQRLLKGNVNDNINLKDLSKGTYIIRLTTQEGTVITEKVIKE